MAKVWVTQYQKLATDSMGRTIMAPEEPAIAASPIDITSGEADSTILDERTAFVDIIGDARFSYEVAVTGATGPTPNPTAVLNDTPVQAGERRFFGIPVFAGRRAVISAILNP